MCTPSRWEGFGIVFIEALACEAIVVTSDIPPMNEYITNGSNGLLVKDYENARTLADTVRKACCDENLRKGIRSRARNSVTRFDRQQVESREAQIYIRATAQTGTDGCGNGGFGPVGQVALGDPVRPQFLTSQLAVVPLQPDLKETWNELVDVSPDAWLYHTYEWQELLSTA